ncbi:NYN domain-containing protein [Bradyrhizobium valentinum]|uniref:NYN domain-containing protein n=1 Tax=Bradyrhizobium valentinum TaxID=1518501 RepID=A0A0R3LEI0_9BRAD|nr:NYN domain-containing protein [Bradyrhizobium valentinum]KRR04271.1 hypothetical protein CP49_23930 [Bradyrhizobium valentinum]
MTERIALFIDGSNFHQTVKGLCFNVTIGGYSRIRQARHGRANILLYADQRGWRIQQPSEPLLDWLDYNGFAVRTKPAKEVDDGDGRRKTKRSMGVELAIDALELARHIDHAFLFSGDGDLQTVVLALQWA